MKERKKVTVFGIIWTVLSANERSCTEAGRHFMASRCSSKSDWYLREHDQNIGETGCAKEVGYLKYRLCTSDLSLAVLDINRRHEVLPVRSMDDEVPLAALIKPTPHSYLARISAHTIGGKA